MGAGMAHNVPPLFLLPGMAANFPVFDRLKPLLRNPVEVSYPTPEPSESVRGYASRMANQLPAGCFIAGVSFGGILALEISRILQPLGCILISSIRGPNQMPPWYRGARVMGGRNCARLLGFACRSARSMPRWLRTQPTLLATQRANYSSRWYQWAIAAILDWRPESQPTSFSLCQIHGDADTTFPIQYVRPDVVIRGGRHALPVSHPTETAQAILAFTQQVQSAASSCDNFF